MTMILPTVAFKSWKWQTWKCESLSLGELANIIMSIPALIHGRILFGLY